MRSCTLSGVEGVYWGEHVDTGGQFLLKQGIRNLFTHLFRRGCDQDDDVLVFHIVSLQ